MAFRYIFDPLRIIASRLVLAFDRPHTILKALNEFEKLFKDDSNFIDPEKWGEKQRLPFTLSDSGMAKMQELKNKSDTFDKIYRAGIAQMERQGYSLMYFLTQYLIVAKSTGQYMEIMADHDGLDSLKEKAQKIDAIPLNLKELYQTKIPHKKYTQEEAQKAKRILLDVIQKFKQAFESLELSPEEEKYFHDKK